MAIKIPLNMMFGTPDIELITDNKISQISYSDSFISNIMGTSEKPYKFKNIFSKRVTCWQSSEELGTNSYIYNQGKNDNVELKTMTSGNDTLFYAVIDLNKIKSDLYYSFYSPDNIVYVEMTQNVALVLDEARGNGLGYWVLQYDKISDKMGDVSQKLVSNRGNINNTSYLYTTNIELSSTEIAKLKFGQVALQHQSTNYEYSDEFTGKLYIQLGSLSPINQSGAVRPVALSFEINLYCPSFELEKTDYVLSNETENVSNSYTMQTNTFMNSYHVNYVGENRTTYFINQAKDILFNYENGRLKANITCNYGKYMNDDGTIAYNGEDGKIIKVGDVVQLNLNKINKNFEVIKSEIVYGGNIRVNLSLEEISKVYGIVERVGDGAIINYNRTYSKIGTVGKISSRDKLYEGDIIQINVNFTNSNAYSLDSIIVNGQEFSNNGTITITKNLNVYASTTVKTFKIYPTIGEGATLVLTRESSQYGKGSLGTISTNDTFYYGDVLIIDWNLTGNYEVRDAYFNDQRLYTAITNRVTITKNSTLNIPTIKLGWHTMFEGEFEYNMLENHGTESEFILDLDPYGERDIRLYKNCPTIFHFEYMTCRYGDDLNNYGNLSGFSGMYGRVNHLGERIWGGDLEGKNGSFSTEPYIIFELYDVGDDRIRQVKVNRDIGRYVPAYGSSTNCIFSEFKLIKIEQYVSS